MWLVTCSLSSSTVKHHVWSLLCGISQGPVLGTIPLVLMLYNLSNTPDLLLMHMLMICNYTATWTLFSLLRCCCNWTDDVEAWMASNRLQHNPVKTHVVWLRSRCWLQQCTMDSLLVCGTVRVILVSLLIVNWQWLATSPGCAFYLIQHTLTVNTAHCIVEAFVHSWLDYCNALFSRLPVLLMARLQSVLIQNRQLTASDGYWNNFCPADWLNVWLLFVTV